MEKICEARCIDWKPSESGPIPSSTTTNARSSMTTLCASSWRVHIRHSLPWRVVTRRFWRVPALWRRTSTGTSSRMSICFLIFVFLCFHCQKCETHKYVQIDLLNLFFARVKINRVWLAASTKDQKKGKQSRRRPHEEGNTPEGSNTKHDFGRCG